MTPNLLLWCRYVPGMTLDKAVEHMQARLCTQSATPQQAGLAWLQFGVQVTHQTLLVSF